MRRSLPAERARRFNAPVSDAYSAQKDAARANRAFYEAFERLDPDMMRAVWLDDDRIQCVHPGWALLSGRARVHGSWQTIFENTKSIEFELSDLQVEVAGPIAWATCIERIRSVAGGEEVEAAAVATNLFVLDENGWKLFLHHASPILRPTSE
jgi:ketosteroid isomerase-like protein